MAMKELSADSWKRQGSSVIWDRDTLQSLLPVASLVSLRTFLTWHDAWPAQLPRNSRTILVGGLQTCLELMSPTEGEAFLLQRVQALISRQQSKMEQVGVVFAFHNATHRAFDVTHRDEEISYKRAGHPLMPLSVPLWGRGSSADIHLVLRSAQPREPIGYHVRRIS
jgi:hypothetical protein